MVVSTDSQKIEEVLSRSIDTIYPSKEEFQKLLESGKQLKIYVGIDPTATYVHLGHATNYIILKRLHTLGHKIIVLVGDFTAKIGDPSDKSAARRRLTDEDVQENLKTFKAQIGKILDFDDTKNPIEFKFNSEWLSKLNFEDVCDLASHFTVQRMLERDNFEKRIKENKPLYVHEFFYPLMQGYDSVAMDVDVELGGTDQTFNMLAGRTLLKDYKNKEKIVVTTTLLENPVTGEKLMSKSLGTGIGLDESPIDMFGKTMRLPDEAIIQVFIDCTYKSMGEIEKMKQELAFGANPRDLKMRLAHEIVKTYHGEEEAQKAEEYFINTFKNKETPDDIKELKPNSYNIVSVLVEAGFAVSTSEARRAISQGGVKLNDEKVESIDVNTKKGDVVQKGKRFFVKII
ncbi:MAG TPA: tyrosine--tRNA ligase [Candidatus Magasanikbacteria bacterium]|nr:MAG: tyrosine--tRNA ligase [Candidatus Magasanikbacteria bacterium RIFOXYC2_FULL_39_8]HAT03644.1 tyrosine--tRNA ligase [Candidatus Magasanikbacteria bacterium]